MKKLLSIVFAILLAITASAFFTACADIGELTHVHTYSSEWTKSETHHYHEATCAHTNEIADKEKHDFSIVEVLEEKTCEYDGLTRYTCSVCGYEKIEFDPTTGHDLETVARKDATCTEDGYTEYKRCKNCDYTEGYEVIPAHHETASVAEVKAACTTAGHSAYEYCTVCGEKFGYIYYPAKGHSMTSEVLQELSCTTDGKVRHYCTECDYEYTVTTHGEHNYAETARKAATCTENGYVEYTCANCKDTYRTEIPGGHNYQSEVTKQATKTEKGVITYTCANCGDTYTEDIPTLPDGNGLVLLVQDTSPWTTNANTVLLNDLLWKGYIEGWTATTSSALKTAADLTVYDVIYVANDQRTATYENLADCKSKLEEFVNAGGVLVYGACDHGWASGNITKLVGAVSKSNYYSYYNYIVNGTHPILTGELTGSPAITNRMLYSTYTSHTYFTSLPENAIVILQDGNGNPTLVEYDYGDKGGKVILSGLTWEYTYVRTMVDGTSFAKEIYDDLIVYAMGAADPCDHEYGEGEVVAPTCTTRGYTSHICAKCGREYKTDFVDALGHDYKYTDNGETHTVNCLTCGETFEEDHAYDSVCDESCNLCGAERVAPHSYTDGWYEYAGYHFKVRNCDCAKEEAESLRNETLNNISAAETSLSSLASLGDADVNALLAKIAQNAALARSALNVDLTEMSVETAVTTAYSMQSKVKVKLAEVYTDLSALVDVLSANPSYSEELMKVRLARTGLQVFITNSYNRLNALVKDKAEHTFDDGEIIAEATCSKEGEIKYTCSVCGYYYTESIEALPHTYSDEWSYNSGYHYHKATCCNVAKDVAAHTLVNGVCTVCGYGAEVVEPQGKAYEWVDDSHKEVYFGSYPQSDVTTSMGADLSGYVAAKPTNGNNNGWTSYKYYISSSNSTDYMWYKDVDVDNNGAYDYRAVYFTSYRPYYTNYSSSTNYTYQDENGYYTGNVYWFKYESIKWRVLASDDGYATILCSIAIDSQDYNYAHSSRTIDGKTINGNNYEYSSIRAWLNETFYETAFNSLQKAIIQTVTIDNSARSTNPNNNATQWNSGVNDYACNDTQDKVWLLSEQEVTTAAYGFNTSYSAYDAARQIQSSDYAKAQGCYKATGTYAGCCVWLLRSPYYNRDYNAWSVGSGGSAVDYSVYYTGSGILPALKITL